MKEIVKTTLCTICFNPHYLRTLHAKYLFFSRKNDHFTRVVFVTYIRCVFYERIEYFTVTLITFIL
jgi:hypothetical protein